MRLRYQNNLNQLARQLRQGGVVSEALLWNELKQRRLGVRFLRQRPVGRYIVDFFCHSLSLVIEVDGAASHDTKIEADQERQRKIESLGIKVIRFKDADVKYNLAGVLGSIKSEILRRATAPPLKKEEKYD